MAELPTYPVKDAERSAVAAQSAQPPAPAVARIVGVEPGSPADDAGFYAGCVITAVDGNPVRDVIDWRWLTADDAITVSYVDGEGDAGDVQLERAYGEDWGFEFDGLVFDGVKQCRNACTFCFMRMLPDEMRPSLYLRDDDFRLSFLVGTFVTLTNLTPEDEARIIEQHISPMRVSLQVSNADVRKRLIGKHAQHGIEALDRLLAAGIEFHAQIVLVPDENDGDVLAETLAWAYERPGILGVGIVPLGYSRHQTTFDRSFNDAAASQRVLSLIEPFQARAFAERGTPWVFAADEFYRNAWGNRVIDHIPPTSHYGDFAMFEDGIGIIRSTIDDWEEAERAGAMKACADALHRAQKLAYLVAGYAQHDFLEALVARSDVRDCLKPLYIKNDFFGGNVDVTGLIVGADIVRTIRELESARQADAVTGQSESRPLYLVPRVIFNDDGLTLDDMTLEDVEKAAGCALHMVSCSPIDYIREICALVSA